MRVGAFLHRILARHQGILGYHVQVFYLIKYLITEYIRGQLVHTYVQCGLWH